MSKSRSSRPSDESLLSFTPDKTFTFETKEFGQVSINTNTLTGEGTKAGNKYSVGVVEHKRDIRVELKFFNLEVRDNPQLEYELPGQEGQLLDELVKMPPHELKTSESKEADALLRRLGFLASPKDVPTTTLSSTSTHTSVPSSLPKGK